MTTPFDDAKIAAALVDGIPLDFKTYPDGSLVVIAPSGQKCQFTPQQVNKAHAALVNKETTKTEPQDAHQSKPSPSGEAVPSTPSKAIPRRSRSKKS